MENHVITEIVSFNKKLSVPEFTFIISILGTFKICQGTTIAGHLRVKLPVICFFRRRNTSCLGKGNRTKSSRLSRSWRRKVCIRSDILEYNPNICNNKGNMRWNGQNSKLLKLRYLIYITRLSSTRDSQWRIANIQSVQSVSDDCAAEQIRRNLELCNLEDAIARFISGNATGSKR